MFPRNGSEDPDQYQNETDPQHCYKEYMDEFNYYSFDYTRNYYWPVYHTRLRLVSLNTFLYADVPQDEGQFCSVAVGNRFHVYPAVLKSEQWCGSPAFGWGSRIRHLPNREPDPDQDQNRDPTESQILLQFTIFADH